MSIPLIDLTQRPPRSPRVRLGGFVILPRMLDKGRATLNQKNGEYHFNCPLDQRFTSFLKVDADGILDQLKQSKGDGEILEWILAHAENKPGDAEIIQWSAFQENRAPSDSESRDYFQEMHRQAGPERSDISSWFDLLDLDDYVSFGGKA